MMWRASPPCPQPQDHMTPARGAIDPSEQWMRGSFGLSGASAARRWSVRRASAVAQATGGSVASRSSTRTTGQVPFAPQDQVGARCSSPAQWELLRDKSGCPPGPRACASRASERRLPSVHLQDTHSSQCELACRCWHAKERCGVGVSNGQLIGAQRQRAAGRGFVQLVLSQEGGAQLWQHFTLHARCA